jgi:hypothetical protein
MKSLGVKGDTMRAVLYVTLVRFFFANAYTMDSSSLMIGIEKSTEFLNDCQKFSEQTVRDFVISPSIIKNFTAGLPLTSLFRARQVQLLKPMEFMTSPIDLMYYVHTVLGMLATQFGIEAGETMLSFDDTLTLLIALLSTSPPSNAVKIAEYIVQWESVLISDVLPLARGYFVAAVEQIVNFGGKVRDADSRKVPSPVLSDDRA